MARQKLNQGTFPTGAGGDNWRTGSAKLDEGIGELYSQFGANNQGVLPSALPINKGGTGATTAVNARTNLDVFSKTEVAQAIEAAKPSVIPDASTSTKGVVQLNNTLISTSVTLALTAAMGKKLQDEKLSKAENAVSASKLETARTVSFFGAATGSFGYDGSANSSCILTLANSGVAASTYGSALKIPVITVNAKGLITGVSEKAIPEVVDASTTAKGVVQLNNTLTSTSIDQALTAAIGKKLQDEKLGKAENAVSTSKLETARTVQFSGAATGSFNYDGSANSSCILTLADSGVVAGTHGNSATVPVITVNAKGLITGVSEKAIPEVVDASTSTKGVVQLNNTLTSTSIDQALTSAMGKKLQDEKLGKAENATSSTTSAACTGNSASATKLQTARKIDGVEFDGTKDIATGGAGKCVAWVVFSGNINAVVKNSANVLSVVRRALGSYIVTFESPMDKTDYAALISAGYASSGPEFFTSPSEMSANSVKINIKSRTGGPVDAQLVSLGVFC